MKKILILGASSDQVPLILTAKELGLYVVVCDNTSTNPGLKYVDKHYQVDYMNKDEVLKVAQEEKIDGVISNSEPAMPNVAFISEKLNLIGNREDSIIRLADKTLFRELQKSVGVFTPKHIEVSNSEEAIRLMSEMSFPVLMKPCECSASRGTFKFQSLEPEIIRERFLESKEYSWNGKVAIEEFIEMPTLTTYEGDVFICNGEILWDGLFYVQRSAMAPMIPMTYIGPVDNDDKNIPSIKDALIKVFVGAGITHGQYNVELYMTKNNQPFIIEINTRQGGRNLPLFIKQFSGLDITRLLVSTSVGNFSYYEEQKKKKRITEYRSHHMLLCPATGIYQEVRIADELIPYLTGKKNYKEYGTNVKKSENGTDTLGEVDFCFDRKETRDKYSFALDKYVKPIINF